jgi:hypothetical protein
MCVQWRWHTRRHNVCWWRVNHIENLLLKIKNRTYRKEKGSGNPAVKISTPIYNQTRMCDACLKPATKDSIPQLSYKAIHVRGITKKYPLDLCWNFYTKNLRIFSVLFLQGGGGLTTVAWGRQHGVMCRFWLLSSIAQLWGWGDREAAFAKPGHIKHTSCHN